MTIADKLITIAENEQKVYDAGIMAGIEADKEKLLKPYFNYLQIYNAAVDSALNKNHHCSSIAFYETEGGYTRFCPDSAYKEAYVYLFKSTPTLLNRYIAIKYRYAANVDDYLEIWADTENNSANAGNVQNMVCKTIQIDGEWHIAVFDAASYYPNEYTPNGDGTYTFKYLRLDVFSNAKTMTDETNYIDIAYIATATSIDKILACNKDMPEVTIVKGEGNEEDIPNPYAQTSSDNAGAELVADVVERTVTSIELPDGMTRIGDYAFYRCSSLTKIVIPATVMSIGDCAFAYCTRLADIVFNGTIAQWKAAEKAKIWDLNTGHTVGGYTVTCTDGIAPKEVLITFTIDEGGLLMTYEAVEGMTWYEWCDSDYNTGGYHTSEGGNIWDSNSIGTVGRDYNSITSDETIIANESYGIV